MPVIVQNAITYLLLVSSLGIVPAPAAAQERADGNIRTQIAGSIVAGNGTTPISGARIVLSSLDHAGPAFHAVTDRLGHYVLHGVERGRYLIEVRRIGYRPTAVEISVVSDNPLHLSLALDVHPIRLTPMAVTANTPSSATRLSDRQLHGRTRETMTRQRQYVSSDVKEVTAHDIAETMTLGDGDVLRTLQTLPGIATKSDWTAELWTRGARWDQTRVYFDDVPVFNPLHTFGMFSAISADAIERVRIHPGVKRASLGEGAAGVVEIVSASARGHHDLSGSAAISTFQGGGTVRLPAQNGAGGLAVSGRVGNTSLRRNNPYGFIDLTGRADIALTPHTALEASFLWSDDRLREYGASSALAARADWQNAVGRTTLVARVGRNTLRQTFSISHSSARTQRRTQPPGPGLASIVTWPTDNSLNQLMARGEFVREVSNWRWHLGYDIQYLRTHYFGSPTAPYALQTFTDTLTYLDRAQVTTAWGDVKWRPLTRLELETGLRAETGGASTPWRAAPHFAVRVTPVDRLLLSAAYGRSFQYAQTLAGSGAVIGPGLQVSQVWLLAGPQVPVLEADIVTAGGEVWLARGLLAGVTFYRRVLSGVVIDDPRPGFHSTRALFVTASNESRGMELSLQKMRGLWTGSLSYAHGSSTMHALGITFPSAAEREHVLDASVFTTLPKPVMLGLVRLGLSTRAASGAPFTRLLPCPATCSQVVASPESGGSEQGTRPTPVFHTQMQLDASDELPTQRASTEWVGQPNARRAPTYWNVDATIEWSRSFARTQITTYMQIRNLFDRTNAVTYIRAGESGCASSSRTTWNSLAGDCFEAGIPFRPIFGLRIRF